MPLICHVNQRGRYECNVVSQGGKSTKEATINRAQAGPTLLPWLGIMKRFIPTAEYSAFDSILRMPPHESSKGADIVDVVLDGPFAVILHTSNVEHITRMVFLYSSEQATIDDFGYTENSTYISRPDTFITQTAHPYRLHPPLHLTGDSPAFIRIARENEHVVIQTSDALLGEWVEQNSFSVPLGEKIVVGMGFIRTFPCEYTSIWKCHRP
jgi:hypothetical protein